MFIDYDKLITAIKYVSRMSKMTIRAYAKHKAHVYNDILFMLRRKLKTNEDIKVKELTKIINGYGLVADRFVYLDKIPRKEKFNPETDLTLL